MRQTARNCIHTKPKCPCEWEALRRKNDEGKDGDEEGEKAQGHPFISVPGQLLPGNSQGIRIILRLPILPLYTTQCRGHITINHHILLLCLLYRTVYIATVLGCSVKQPGKCKEGSVQHGLFNNSLTVLSCTDRARYEKELNNASVQHYTSQWNEMKCSAVRHMLQTIAHSLYDHYCNLNVLYSSSLL